MLDLSNGFMLTLKILLKYCVNYYLLLWQIQEILGTDFCFCGCGFTRLVILKQPLQGWALFVNTEGHYSRDFFAEV